METNQFIYKNETYNIIGAAMEVHKTLGIGMLLNFGEESLYFKRFPNITPKPICTNPQL